MVKIRRCVVFAAFLYMSAYAGFHIDKEFP